MSKHATLACLTQKVGAAALILTLCGHSLWAQETSQDQPRQKPAKNRAGKKVAAPFKWVNPIPQRLKASLPATLSHATFASRIAGSDVGYCIYLPPEYDQPEFTNKRFPVVYYLHGGRPGNETKSIRLAAQMEKLSSEHSLPPMIYVFVNGGPVSHYNLPGKPESQGADVFIKELIPHVDATYRTIAKRSGRGLEGFSQGGRGTARLMFRYPELFSSASPGGGGHATEKKISESGGFENPKLKFGDGDNTWDLARRYAEQASRGAAPKLSILVHVGDKGFNYQNNLEWMKHLKSLGIPYQRVIVPDVGHSAADIYRKEGLRIMRFHADNLSRS